MAVQRTVTTPGSYERPVEGIVDYSAFQKGFDENFNIEDVEKAVVLKKIKFNKKVEEIFKQSDLATGSFLDDQGKIILNPNIDTKNNYKEKLLTDKDEYINPKTTRERKKEIELSVSGRNATNETVKYLVSSLNSGDAVSLRGSTVEELFEEQGVTFEEFSESYNNGNFFPSEIKNNRGNIIHGAEILDKNGQRKFIDLTGKINPTTIADKLAINSEPDVKKAITEYKAKGGKSFNETDLFKSGDTGNTVKRTRLVNQYKNGVYASADSQANEFIASSPDLMRGLYADATVNTDIYTEAEQEFIEINGFKYEGTRGGASNIYYIYAKQVEEDMGLSMSGNNYVITKEDGTTETIDPKSNRGKNITTQVDAKTKAAIKQTKDGIVKKHLKNRFLSNVDDFYTQDKNVTFNTSDSEYTNNKSYYDSLFSEEIANGQTTFTLKKGANYPRKDLYQTTGLASPEKPETGGGSGGRKQTGNVKGRLFNIASNLNSSVYDFATPGSTNYLKEDGTRTIDIKGLGQGFIADTDGTKAEITNGSVIREGDRMFLELTYEAAGTDKVEKFPLARIKDNKAITDFDGRKRLTERIYKGQFGASTADAATDLLTGEQNIYKDRTKVQDYFFMSGKDETMFRRLDIIRKFEENPDDPTVFDNLTEDDKKQLGRARSEGTIGYNFQQAYIKSKKSSSTSINPLLN